MKLIKVTLSLLVIFPLLFVIACNSSVSGANVELGTVTDFRTYREQPLAKNQPAPDFQFQMPNGDTMLLSDLKGKTVLLNFWAVSCPYCILEMPYLEAAYDALSADSFVFLGINVGESMKTVTNFLKDKDISFPIILDPDYFASILYNAQYLPVTYLIDKTGNIYTIKIGAFTNGQQVITALQSLPQ
jgi:peroxiredoxin